MSLLIYVYIMYSIPWERKHLTDSRHCHLLSIKVNCIKIVVGFYTFNFTWISNGSNYMPDQWTGKCVSAMMFPIEY